ncbi:MAG: hypothetical protein Aureis2KO_17930 [Aureisphaera sp.]
MQTDRLSTVDDHTSVKTTHRILNSWLEAHNSKSKKKCKKFVKRNYSKQYLKKINEKEHIDFYYNGSLMFGELNREPYKVVKDEALLLIVQFTKLEAQGQPLHNDRKGIPDDSINPEDIIEVTIKLNDMDPTHLNEGLGIGPLLCIPD